jgi:mannose-1-phosphate guanylyltransferase / mannose-6-phosphate isomerase
MAASKDNPGRIYPVILSGGSGTRLWPLSRTLYPKQLLPLLSERSLLQEAALRVTDARFAAPVIVANDEHRFIVAEHLRAAGIRPQAIVLEPVGRNTAPAIAVAAMVLGALDKNALMLVMPSDHAIADVPAFLAAVDCAAVAARAGRLATFGIAADRPETGYGSLRHGAPIALADGAFEVEAFIEKPDAAHAQSYLAAGDYSWNSGIFLFPAALFLAELEARHAATVAACRQALDQAKRDLDFLRLDGTAFAAAENTSVDYAVMEHSTHVAVIPVDMGWSDIGTWDALWLISSKDTAGNVSQGDVIVEDARNCYLRAEHGLVAALGVDDLVVVATADVVMVAPRDRAQDVKRLVTRLERDGRSETAAHPLVHRPWGSFRSIHNGDRVQVKHITVKPGAKLSLQMHHHRAEHWVVVQGTAKVVRGKEELVLHEDQSTYIPLGTPHRLENPGKIPLHVIEVQSGSYLGEDDIVRFDDTYGRS